jgi:hypothetical protein
MQANKQAAFRPQAAQNAWNSAWSVAFFTLNGVKSVTRRQPSLDAKLRQQTVSAARGHL